MFKWWFVPACAALLHDLSPVEARQLAESVIAVNYRPLHDLGVSQEEAGLCRTDGTEKNIKYESQIKGCRAFWASGEDLKESQLFIILKSQFKNQPCCSKVENFTGSGGLIWIEVSVILYTQKQEGNKTSSQSKGSITAADHLLRVLKKLRSGPLKAAAHCLPFEIKALSKMVGLNHLDLPAKQLLIPIFSKKKKVLQHLWFLLLSSNL